MPNHPTMLHVIRYTDTDGPHELIYTNPHTAHETHQEFTDWHLNPTLTRERFTHRKHNPRANPHAEWMDTTCPT